MGYYLTFQILACNCDVQGSIDVSCDDNGKCNCKVNFAGDKCNECADGYFDYPTCQGNPLK